MCCDGTCHRRSAPVTVGAVDDYTCMEVFMDEYVYVWMTKPAVTNPAITIRDHRHLATNDLELDI